MPSQKSCPSCNAIHSKRGPYCSRSCGNSRTYTPEQKLQKSLSHKNPTIHVTQAELKELFDYDPINGGLLHRTERHNAYGVIYQNGESRIGKSTAWTYKTGYKGINVKGKVYREHRVVYYWHTGEYPRLLDHIDRNKGNNRIENLREATYQENMANVDWPTIWDNRKKKWAAQKI
jgi:hypothetical protein